MGMLLNGDVVKWGAFSRGAYKGQSQWHMQKHLRH